MYDTQKISNKSLILKYMKNASRLWKYKKLVVEL